VEELDHVVSIPVNGLGISDSDYLFQFHGLNSSVSLLAVVALQVDFFDLAHQGISGVGASALVVKGILHHLVQSIQEVLLVHAVVLDGLLDADLLLQIFQSLDEVFKDLVVVLALDAAELGSLHVALLGMGVLVLGEGTHLGGNFRGVVADDVGENQGVGHAVGQVMVSAQLVSHGVVHTQEGVGEGHTSHAGGLGHALAGIGIVGAVLVGGGQVIEHSLHGLQGQAVGKGSGHDGHIGLDGVGHHVDTGGGGQALGLGHHVVGGHNSHGGQQLVVSQRPLGAGLLIGDDGEGSHFG